MDDEEIKLKVKTGVNDELHDLIDNMEIDDIKGRLDLIEKELKLVKDNNFNKLNKNKINKFNEREILENVKGDGKGEKVVWENKRHREEN